MATGLFDTSRLYEALKQYGLLPKHANMYPAGEATGLFSAELNRMVAPDASLSGRNEALRDQNISTLAHEMSHAVQQNLLMNTAIALQEKKQKGEKLSDQEQQYLRASEQIFVDQFGNVGSFDKSKYRADTKSYENMSKKMYSSPVGDKEFERYRRSPMEAQAFGVGKMSVPSNQRSEGENPHFNPSMATEFDLLLSMYEKLPESLKSLAAASKKDSIEKNRKDSKDFYLNLSTDIFKNPFESTIK